LTSNVVACRLDWKLETGSLHKQSTYFWSFTDQNPECYGKWTSVCVAEFISV